MDCNDVRLDGDWLQVSSPPRIMELDSSGVKGERERRERNLVLPSGFWLG